ncbi:hypothetical protein PUR_34840 [Paenibacillus sp. URB8-2]|nr:hypothetical protein PUR_34840 [Paenibacillus sp. URB8-2]
MMFNIKSERFVNVNNCGVIVLNNVVTILQDAGVFKWNPPEQKRSRAKLNRKINESVRCPVAPPIIIVMNSIRVVFNIIPNEYCMTSIEQVCSGLVFLMAVAILLAKLFIVTAILFVRKVDIYI